MRSLAEYEKVRTLFGSGLTDLEISHLMGIPRRTVRDWRVKPQPVHQKRDPDPDCPACAGATIEGPKYAYLLGLYLGDGCISGHPRGVYRLRITMDLRYPMILDECARAISDVRRSFPMKVGRVAKIGCMEIGAYWKHWPCLFPQHGPGPKHERGMRLVPWQREIANRNPGPLLRGLIHSDGYRGLNWVNGTGYPRYQFSNRSRDILDIFCGACDDYGVSWRKMNQWTISVARRPDVAKLDRIIGPKA